MIDLVTQSLQYSPIKRITPAEALHHDYFDELRDEARFFELKQKYKQIPDLFNYTEGT